MTQCEFAKKIHVSQVTTANWESDKHFLIGKMHISLCFY
jgi:DNA-binding XRE family transcriptional regulator